MEWPPYLQYLTFIEFVNFPNGANGFELNVPSFCNNHVFYPSTSLLMYKWLNCFQQIRSFLIVTAKLKESSNLSILQIHLDRPTTVHWCVRLIQSMYGFKWISFLDGYMHAFLIPTHTLSLSRSVSVSPWFVYRVLFSPKIYAHDGKSKSILTILPAKSWNFSLKHVITCITHAFEEWRKTCVRVIFEGVPFVPSTAMQRIVLFFKDHILSCRFIRKWNFKHYDDGKKKHKL